jgi:hypothetical protein
MGWATFWATFSQTHLVTLVVTERRRNDSMAGLPDGLFSSQNPNLGTFWRALDWKMLIYFMAIGDI